MGALLVFFNLFARLLRVPRGGCSCATPGASSSTWTASSATPDAVLDDLRRAAQTPSEATPWNVTSILVSTTRASDRLCGGRGSGASGAGRPSSGPARRLRARPRPAARSLARAGHGARRRRTPPRLRGADAGHRRRVPRRARRGPPRRRPERGRTPGTETSTTSAKPASSARSRTSSADDRTTPRDAHRTRARPAREPPRPRRRAARRRSTPAP